MSSYVAQAIALGAGVTSHLTAGLAVSDSAANVASGLSGLQTIATAGKLGTITLSDSTTPTISLTAATLAADAGALAAIAGRYNLTVSSGTVTAARAAALGAGVISHLTAGLAV